jgi:hypothetical protein
MNIRQRQEELLQAAILLLDGERSDHVRASAAEHVTTSLDSDEWTWVEGVLLSAPLPAGADIAGAVRLAPQCEQFLQNLQRDQFRSERWWQRGSVCQTPCSRKNLVTRSASLPFARVFSGRLSVIVCPACEHRSPRD